MHFNIIQISNLCFQVSFRGLDPDQIESLTGSDQEVDPDKFEHDPDLQPLPFRCLDLCMRRIHELKMSGHEKVKDIE